MSPRGLLVTGCVLGCLGVILGAFGAHGLEGAVQEWESEPAAQRKLLDTWDVAVRYQMYHALALLAAGLMSSRAPSRAAAIAGVFFLLGIVIFSGCLYLLVLSGVKILGAIVPIGGLSMIAGWVALAMAANAAAPAEAA